MEMSRRITVLAWSLSGVAVGLSIVAWAQTLPDDVSVLSTYQVFPVFGLVAFSLMWAHYVSDVLSHYVGQGNRLKRYFRITSAVVLVAILLHPSLYIVQLYNDGQGLPPFSYINDYPGAMNSLALLSGSVGLLAFLAYELHRWFSKRRWWKYIQYVSDIAMLLILLHGFTLGTVIDSGWFGVVWWLYTITYLAALAYIYTQHTRSRAVDPQ